ncbi:metallophosphoesterase [Lactobacillus gigeriorum]|uniref:Serine threonine protein phosphatase n=1 Tax=Lactobacillus gigeriorum DSM 23908 = CRBIP 24.85 TaxID=1423751 RepID=I7K238_9LACO|nr:metallophosphoesterase [Lactobacillus gigeriorum]KRN14583.1 serine threonine protein phosphatase [Lactobacillus gigeriorum DSM 23908 = CRBIP 24.85]CCI87820.1 Serine/threonine protein phosphatase family protein [Lactobacillus gigeriorum DSM 23908 = CRBIP 24.85]
MITSDLNTEIWVISDTHLIADSLHDNGQAFSRMQKTSQGKDLYYQETALSTFCRMAEIKKPAAIIVTGDVTFNGERVSAERFAKIFTKLSTTKLLVVPGNHDIFDGWAREFRGKKQFFAGEISPRFWKNIFQKSYALADSVDYNSLAYAVQLNPIYYLLMLDSNYYGKEETTETPHTRGAIGKEQLKWVEERLKYASKNNLRPIIFMHHNLYAHNPAVNRGYVLDDAVELRRLCSRYNVKLAYSGHIHAQNIMGPQDMTPTTEIVTSSFCSNDQGYGVTRIHSHHITYVRKEFNMHKYLTEEEKQNYTLDHFDNYLENLQLGTIAADLMQSDLKKYHNNLDLIRKMGKLFAKMNYNFYTGHNHLKAQELNNIHASQEYQTLIKQHPEYRIYLKTLYDTSDHSNLQVKITY